MKNELNKDTPAVEETKEAPAPEIMPSTKLAEGTVAAAPAEEQPTEAASIEDRVGQVIDQWFEKVSRNTPLSRATPALNYVRDKLTALKAAVIEETK